MSTPNKARGGSDSQLTRLKQLPPENHEVIWSWRDENPPLTNAQIRNRLATTFSVRLKLDKQLSQFWSWYGACRELSATNDLIETFEEFTRTQHPDWSAEKVRQTGISFFMANSVAQQDADKFATIVTLDQRERFGKTKASQNERKLSLDERKVKLLEQKAAAFDQAKGVLENKELTEAQRAARMREVFGISG